MNGSEVSVIETSRLLISATNEKDIIQILIQSALELTGSKGGSFVPLDDRGLPMAAVRQGEFPVSIPDAWLEFLASPAIRSNCSQCFHTGEVVENCQLLEGPFANASGVYCFPLRYVDHDLGILNLYLSSPLSSGNGVFHSLQYLAQIAALAIAHDRLKRRELAMFDQFRSLRQKNGMNSMFDHSGSPKCFEDRLVELEYKIQMEERTRLAREIHDGLAQTLGFLKLQVAQLIYALEKDDPERTMQLSRSVYDALEDAYLEAREAMNLLRVVPGEPGEARFKNWLQQIVKEFQENTEIQVHIDQFSLSTDLPDEVHLQMIRIVQEALTNVRKHAQAHRISITCVERDQNLLMEIQDDGLGFCVDEVPEFSQHGIKGMRERANLIGAEIRWLSQPGSGTLVQISLPLLKRKAV